MSDSTTSLEAVDTSKKAEYNRTYYAAKRDDLLTRKRIRYSQDPDYREKLKADASKRRKDNRTGPTISFNGRSFEALRASDLAEQLGKSLSTINFWQKHGTIPETPFRSEGGYRLYTNDMVDGIKSALAAIPRPDRGDPVFGGMVREAWVSAGVPLSRD
jgi:hypothetical protein